MGNTNLPQAGSAGHKNSRDSRSGIEQLTDKQQEQLGEPATDIETPNPAVTPDEAIIGDIDTGHSPSDATRAFHLTARMMRDIRSRFSGITLRER